MTPDIWDGLVIGVTLIGFSLAVLRLMHDWQAQQRTRRRASTRPAPPASPRPRPPRAKR